MAKSARDQSEYEHFPLRSFIGMDIDDIEPGHAITRVEVTENLLNPNGVVHGGVMFTMIDTAMGKATMTSLGEGQFCASIEIHIRFLRPAGSGRLEAGASVIRPGRKIVHLESHVRDGDGSLIATGTGTFAVISAP